MKADIRLSTVLIIRKGGKYLTGRNPVTGEFVWRSDKWDAWGTRIRAEARSVAEKSGGEILLWNPIAGQIRKYAG